MGDRIRFLTVRRASALAVVVLALDAVLSGAAHVAIRGPGLRLESSGLPSETHILSLFVGLGLLALTPRLWRGTRTAVSLTALGMATLAALSAFRGHWGPAVIQLSLSLLLIRARESFPLGCRNRPRGVIVALALAAWGLAYAALRLAPLVPLHLARALHHPIIHAGPARLSAHWLSAIDLLIACAALISALAMRSLLRPVPADNGPSEHEYRAARAIVDSHGHDSLSPFVVRPEKALQFAAGGVLSYRVLRGTAIVSSDPVAPGGAESDVLESFLPVAHRRGWQVALWGASGQHLEAYRALGLRALCVGEEAFVDPAAFTLEGRPVRKLRQSVHRVQRRGWEVTVTEGRLIDTTLEAEIDALELRWRIDHPHLHGFAMGMGAFGAEVRPDDLYALAHSPEGELGAVMRFISHCGHLSLDAMRRVGDTPNGLNEALVCATLAVARARGVPEVSLNYAGLAHLLRGTPSRNPIQRIGRALVLAPLRRHFQMDRLVRFNDKFSPEWRPRYLVYETRTALPRTVLRVLQAEGYLPARSSPRAPGSTIALPGLLARSTQAKSAG